MERNNGSAPVSQNLQRARDSISPYSSLAPAHHLSQCTRALFAFLHQGANKAQEEKNDGFRGAPPALSPVAQIRTDAHVSLGDGFLRRSQCQYSRYRYRNRQRCRFMDVVTALRLPYLEEENELAADERRSASAIMAVVVDMSPPSPLMPGRGASCLAETSVRTHLCCGGRRGEENPRGRYR